MITGLTHMHSLLRWVILILLIYTIIRSFQGKAGKEARYLTIVTHIMLLIGLAQWFMGNWGLKLIQANGMGEVMKSSAQRFFVIEHTLTMIIATVLITMGGVFLRNGKSSAKWLYVVALLLILSRIPWPFMDAGIARGWFPGVGV
jgi:uncharacterized membrane protein